MKVVSIGAFNGDAMLIRRKEVPPGAREVDPVGGQYMVAHSETGHHHVVGAEGVKLFEGDNPFVAYLRMETVDTFDLVHLRDSHTHETIRFKGEPGAVYEIHRQRELGVEGWRRVQD